MNVWELPGPAGFLEAVERSLRDGASVVVRFPLRMTAQFDDVVQACCDFATWTVFRPDGAQPPCKSLLERFAPRGSSLADLCAASDFQARLIWIDGLDQDTWPDCRQFLTDYAQYSRNVAKLGRTQFLVLLVGAPPEEPPPRDATLRVHDWRDAVSEMDLLFLAYERLGVRGFNETMRVLLATIVARVASWDLGTAERLLEAENEDNLIDPTDLLQAIATNEGWTCETLAEWALGTASGTGVVHAALAALEKPPRELCWRVWSAQASVLLPIIEKQRYEIVQANDRKIVTHLQRDGLSIDPLDLEIGALVGMVRRQGFSRHVFNRVKRLHKARNDLAHLRPLGLDAVRALVRS